MEDFEYIINSKILYKMYDIYVKTYRYIFFFISNRKNRGIYREEPGRRTFDLPDGINYTYAVVEFGIYIREMFFTKVL